MLENQKRSLKDVAVVILNYNGKGYLETFLPSVLRFSSDAQVIVADNNSTDDSIHFMKTEYPTVRLIEMEENTGFCGGYNEALKHVTAKYYVLLNSDVEVTENWIEPIISLMESDESIAAAQPKIKLYADKSKFEYAGGAGGFIDFLGYPFCRGRVFDELETDKGQYNDNCAIFWATGACMFVRAELYHQFGGLDEMHFAHMEEIDLCWKMKNAGHQIWYCGESEVYHVGGGTLPKSSPRKTFLNFRNSLFMLFKNLPASQLFLILFSRMVLDGLSGMLFLSKGEWKNFMAIPKAHIDFYKHIPQLLKKRKATQNSVNSHKHAERKGYSLIWKHFIKGKKYFHEIHGK